MRRIERRAPLSGGRVCVFTGHRPSKYPYLADENAPQYKRLIAELSAHVDKAVKEGYTHFVCGGALGTDMAAAKLMLAKRFLDSRLTLEIAVPCDGQDRFWSKKDRRRYADILSQADVVTYISTAYTPFCMRERNQYMIELSQRLIAVFDGSEGGTYMTVLLALNQGIEVEIIKP